MPDSPPPNGGPGPYDGWDLEGLLSGDNVWLPEGMRPVAAKLGELRSDPTPAELSGEAAARAMFRDITGVGAGDASTLILPARMATEPRLVARPRHSHRRPPRRARWRSKALLGAAGGTAAVVIVGGIALAGAFSGAGGRQGQPGRGPAATSAVLRPSRTATNGVEGTASTAPSPTPSRSTGKPSPTGGVSAAGPGKLCRQYLNLLVHPDWAERGTEGRDFQRLSKLAGGPWNVIGYCMRYQSWQTPSGGSYSGNFGFPPSDSQGWWNSGDTRANANH